MPISKIVQDSINGGVAGTGPAFSAYANATQAPTSNVWTKIQCNIEEFDTSSAYDNATNYRFTPQVAGYYQINSLVSFSGLSSSAYYQCAIYKNGVAFKAGQLTVTAASASYSAIVSCIVYFNGTTDYIELYGWSNATTVTTIAGASSTYFQASMVRST